MKFILIVILSICNIAVAVPGNIEELLNDKNVISKLQDLSTSGWETTGTAQIVPLQSFYYTNNSQGKTILLVQPIYGARYMMTSCIAAVFKRGGSIDFGFVDFSQIAGQCQL